jgi:hypothetical protein
MMKSKIMRWTGHVTLMREKRNAYRILVGKLEEMRPVGRPRCSWVDNIKTDIRETEWGGMAGSIWLRIGTSGGLLRTW